MPPETLQNRCQANRPVSAYVCVMHVGLSRSLLLLYSIVTLTLAIYLPPNQPNWNPFEHGLQETCCWRTDRKSAAHTLIEHPRDTHYKTCWTKKTYTENEHPALNTCRALPLDHDGPLPKRNMKSNTINLTPGVV